MKTTKYYTDIERLCVRTLVITTFSVIPKSVHKGNVFDTFDEAKAHLLKHLRQQRSLMIRNVHFTTKAAEEAKIALDEVEQQIENCKQLKE